MAHDAIPLDRETMNLDTVARALRVSRPVVYAAARRIALLFSETEQGKSLCCGGDAWTIAHKICSGISRSASRLA